VRMWPARGGLRRPTDYVETMKLEMKSTKIDLEAYI